VSTPTYQVGESFEFALSDTGAGGETRTATELAGSHDYVVAVLLRDHYCPRSRQLVQSLAAAYEELAGRSTAVVPVLPDCPERASVWQRRYDLPFGLLTDPKSVADDGNAFDAFEPFQRLLPACPGSVLFESDGDQLRFVRTVQTDRASDASAVDAVLAAIDEHATDSVVDPVGTGPDAEAAGDGF